jgi:hypothetical protein
LAGELPLYSVDPGGIKVTFRTGGFTAWFKKSWGIVLAVIVIALGLFYMVEPAFPATQQGGVDECGATINGLHFTLGKLKHVHGSADFTQNGCDELDVDVYVKGITPEPIQSLKLSGKLSRWDPQSRTGVQYKTFRGRYAHPGTTRTNWHFRYRAHVPKGAQWWRFDILVELRTAQRVASNTMFQTIYMPETSSAF